MLRLLIAGILTSNLLMSAWAGKPPEAPSRWLLRFKPEIDLWVTQIAEPEQARRAVATLGREGQLLHAEPDAMIFHADATPNDPLSASQTELEKIRIRRQPAPWPIPGSPRACYLFRKVRARGGGA